MQKPTKFFGFLFAATFFALLSSCGSKSGNQSGEGAKVKSARAGVNEVITHINASPDKLNPVTATNAYASQVYNFIFMALLDLDPDSIGVIFPSVAVARPTITE